MKQLAVSACLLVFLSTAAVWAQSPNIALPVGQSATFRITSQTNDSQNQDVVGFTRINPTTFNVSVNGAAPVPVELNPGGNIAVPQAASRALAPFKQIAVIMRGAPQPLERGSSWLADMPIPVRDQTDTVPLVVTVASFGPGGMTVHAQGQDATFSRKRLRETREAINVSYVITFGPGKTVTYAEGNIGVDASRRFISKEFGSTWTLTRTGG